MGKVKHGDVRPRAQQVDLTTLNVLEEQATEAAPGRMCAPGKLHTPPWMPVARGVRYLAVLAVATVMHSPRSFPLRSLFPQSEFAEEVVRVDTGSTLSVFETPVDKSKAGHLDVFRRHRSGRLTHVDFTVLKALGGMSVIRLRQCSMTSDDNGELSHQKDHGP